ncbi:MAG: hydroxymethylbilane synthase [Planctomycetes bacterium]|nr:hydroxymethylbilane synthase [Planctomycetota bacterium]
MSSTLQIRLGTRASALALWQADWVTARLTDLGVSVVQVEISTIGDRQQEPLGVSTSPGVFTKEIQRALLEERIDLAVHSLKDLPTDEVPGLCLAAIPERAPVGDAIVCRSHGSFQALPPGATVGTGSLRRRSQLLHVRSDLQMKDIRGNVDTRLRKLDEGQYDAIVLAEAGLRRLGFQDRITELLPIETVLPAVGQGALGLESRDDDHAIREALGQLDHAITHASVLAERIMLAELRGGCLAPIAAWGRIENGALCLTGRVISTDGTEKLEATANGDVDDPVRLGSLVAQELAAQGAADLIRLSREGS